MPPGHYYAEYGAPLASDEVFGLLFSGLGGPAPALSAEPTEPGIRTWVFTPTPGPEAFTVISRSTGEVLGTVEPVGAEGINERVAAALAEGGEPYSTSTSTNQPMPALTLADLQETVRQLEAQRPPPIEYEPVKAAPVPLLLGRYAAPVVRVKATDALEQNGRLAWYQRVNGGVPLKRLRAG
jgi:hypothetical protein